MRPTSSLPLAPSVLKRLNACGYRSVRDVSEKRAQTLSRQLHITHEAAIGVIDCAKQELRASAASVKEGKTALEMLRMEKSVGSITSLCSAVDGLFQGRAGIPLGQMTEICGVPGIGKTQWAQQLCVNAGIPAEAGGLGAGSVYIDTEGSLMVHRLQTIAEHADNSFRDRNELHSALENIHVYRVHDYSELLSVVNVLPEFLESCEKKKKKKKIRLVVVDSIAFHFRHEISDMAKRARILSQLAQDLNRLANERGVAILIVNQVTTKFSSQNGILVPALGESWSHAATNRVELFWKGHMRMARLSKSPSMP
eukprot:g2849.t1